MLHHEFITEIETLQFGRLFFLPSVGMVQFLIFGVYDFPVVFTEGI
jgi:hypothetical protein